MDFINWIWLGITALLLVIEGITVSLISIWFALGAAVAFIMSILGCSLMSQIIVFAIVSAIMLIFTKPVCEKHLHIGKVKTNVNALIGEEAIVTTEILPFATGQVMIKKQIWTAISEDNEAIEKNEIVIVKEIEGVKAVVARKVS